MSQPSSDIQILFSRYKDREASPEEIKALFQLISAGEHSEALALLIQGDMESAEIEETDQQRIDTVYNRIQNEIKTIEAGDQETDQEKEVARIVKLTSKRAIYRWPLRAAAILLLLGAALLVYKISQNYDSSDNNTLTQAEDIGPGKPGATLTLSNGKKIRLSEANTGKLASEAGVSITKAADGSLTYELNAKQTETSGSNTLSTARGETYQVRLPDGSKVYLNAASAISYAANLTKGDTREVELSGEGYFEVAKDAHRPFIVKTQSQQVTVLGTHFNVNAYNDEPLAKTTLLEGSVKISLQNQIRILKPGEEAQSKANTPITIRQVDPEFAIAWKNNKFVFGDTDFKTIMRMIERWYNVEVIYQGEIPEDNLSGSVSRFDNISSVLKILESAGDVHFRLQGRKLYVSK